mmetsp:Transcript_9453/g.26972  ORF Transcript_9453/g.26972 Transcript_9453/m.26972 type:complete len:947 (+) Transcript_9453:680-3520(+)
MGRTIQTGMARLQTANLITLLIFVCIAFRSAAFDRQDETQEELLKFTYASYLGWAPETDYCYWTGLACDSRGVLVQIDLHSRNLQGDLPQGWAKFRSLRVLRLDGNSFSGRVPDIWKDLESLEYMYLNGNALTGELPAEWCEYLTKLQHMYLHDNQLTGHLPEECSGLEQLRVLHLERNEFSGSLPRTWGKLKRMQYMYLGGNNLEGQLPNEWRDMKAIVHMHLQNNTISGPIPADWLESMEELEAMHLSNNQLTSTIPGKISNLRKLKELALDNNKISGSLPSEISALRALKQLYFYDNELTGGLPDAWAVLSNLMEMHLDGNHLNGPLPTRWGALQSMEYLYLKDNDLTGVLPDTWAALSDLRIISVAGNSISGPMPDSWGQLYNLELLVLNDNALQGSLPDKWQEMDTIEFIHIYDNDITGTLPGGWSKLYSLQQLVLRGNSLTGAVPWSWRTRLNHLTLLDVSKNNGICFAPNYLKDSVFWDAEVPEVTDCMSPPPPAAPLLPPAPPNPSPPPAPKPEPVPQSPLLADPPSPENDNVVPQAWDPLQWASGNQGEVISGRLVQQTQQPLRLSDNGGTSQYTEQQHTGNHSTQGNGFTSESGSGLDPSSEAKAGSASSNTSGGYANVLEEMGGEYLGSPYMGYVIVGFLLLMLLVLVLACTMLCRRARRQKAYFEEAERAIHTPQRPSYLTDVSDITSMVGGPEAYNRAIMGKTGMSMASPAPSEFSQAAPHIMSGQNLASHSVALSGFPSPASTYRPRVSMGATRQVDNIHDLDTWDGLEEQQPTRFTPDLPVISSIDLPRAARAAEHRTTNPRMVPSDLRGSQDLHSLPSQEINIRASQEMSGLPARPHLNATHAAMMRLSYDDGSVRVMQPSMAALQMHRSMDGGIPPVNLRSSVDGNPMRLSASMPWGQRPAGQNSAAGQSRRHTREQEKARGDGILFVD